MTQTLPDRQVTGVPTGPAAPVPARAGKIALALAAVYLVWGSTYFAIQMAIESMPPLLMAGGRFVLAGGMMVGFARCFLHTPWPTARQWRGATVVGSCLLLGGNGGVVLAEHYIPSGLTAMLVATVPMFLLIFGWLAGVSPRPSALTFFALALGFAGTCLLVRSAPAAVGAAVPITRTQLYTGSALVLVAAMVWAAGSLYAKRADKPASAVLNIGTQMLAGGVLLLVASGCHGEWTHFDPGVISARSGWAFIYLVFVGALVGFSAYIWLLGAATPALVGTYAFVNPGVAVLLGWAFAGEAVNATMGLGMGVVLVAVALIVLFPTRPEPVTGSPLVSRSLDA